MEVKAYIKYLRISPKKLRLLVDDIKRQTPRVALELLPLSSKRGSKFLFKAIKSAVNNAKVKISADIDDLRFKAIIIESGAVLKRFRAGSKGRANQYKRRSSHIKVILESLEKEKNKTDIKPIETNETKKIKVTKVKKIPPLNQQGKIKKE